MKSKREKPRRSERIEDAKFLEFVHGQDACMLSLWQDREAKFFHRCEGKPEAHHAGPRPFGRRADDWTSVLVCSAAHREIDSGKRMTQLDRRDFSEWAIEKTQKAYGGFLSCVGDDCEARILVAWELHGEYVPFFKLADEAHRHGWQFRGDGDWRCDVHAVEVAA